MKTVNILISFIEVKLFVKTYNSYDFTNNKKFFLMAQFRSLLDTSEKYFEQFNNSNVFLDIIFFLDITVLVSLTYYSKLHNHNL